MKPKIISVTELITPEKAIKYLERNYANNRRAKHDNIDKMASDMKKGEWALTHQGIALDPEGYLFDGANRMRAVIKAGVPVEMQVSRYTDWAAAKKALFVLDIGLRRTFRDNQKIAGEDTTPFRTNGTMISMVRRMVAIDNGRFAVNGISDAEIRNYMDEHTLALTNFHSICHGLTGKMKGRNVPAIVAVALFKAYLYGIGSAVISDFTDAYANNTINFPGNDYNVSMALNCRDYANNVLNKKTTTVVEMYRIENYIYSFANNRKGLGKGERYPVNTLI